MESYQIPGLKGPPVSHQRLCPCFCKSLSRGRVKIMIPILHIFTQEINLQFPTTELLQFLCDET